MHIIYHHVTLLGDAGLCACLLGLEGNQILRTGEYKVIMSWTLPASSHFFRKAKHIMHMLNAKT